MDAKKVDWLKRLQILSKALKKNGVKTNMWTEIESKAIGYELDFSEHDKVFEDKIAELKKDYKTASELLGKYQQENESLKKRVVELENFSCQAEQETESLVEELKQRIAKLEGKNNQLTESILRKEKADLQKVNDGEKHMTGIHCIGCANLVEVEEYTPFVGKHNAKYCKLDFNCKDRVENEQ